MKKFFALTVLIILLFTQCKKKDIPLGNNAGYDMKYINYISDYTTGTVSKRSKISVTLANEPDAKDINENGLVKSGILNITPPVKGKALWDGKRKIVFHSETLLTPGSIYNVELKLDKLFDNIESDLSVFNFNFFVIQKDFEITFDDISFYSENGKEYQKTGGIITASDSELSSDIESIINYADIEWDHHFGLNQHKFIIKGLERKEENYNISINYDGTKFGVNKKGRQDVIVYGISGFHYIEHRLIKNDENYVSVTFSNQLDRRQNLKGLISINGSSNVRVIAESNKLMIFPGIVSENTLNIKIDSNIKDSSGNTLPNDVEVIVSLRQEKPQIKFNDNKGGILPGSDGFIIPFQAISLKAVDITVVEIFENNMVQFFQSNSNLSGSENIVRVGRPVIYKTVSLESRGVNLYQWNTFNIDLSDFITARKGALYQVRINFRRSQSLFTCSDSGSDEAAVNDEMLKDDWDSAEQNSYWNYYGYYYDWNNRDNPCSDAYYGKRREISKNILASEIGIIAKGSDNLEYSVYVTNIRTTESIANADVEFYNYQSQLMLSGKTDSNGVFNAKLNNIPFLAVVKNGKERGYIRIDDSSALTLSRFDVGGTGVKKGIKGFIYGDRGVWRPGDTVFLNFILYDRDRVLPVGHPVVFELFDPNGKPMQRNVRNNPVGNIYNFTFKTDADAVTGNYQAKIRVGSEVFTRTLKIETIKPNRLKIDLDFKKDSLTAADGVVRSFIKANWLHGTPAGNMKTEVTVLYSPVKTIFKGYSGFKFDDPAKSFHSGESVVFEGVLDNSGSAEFLFRPDALSDAPGMVSADFISKVIEDGGDYSIDRLEIPYYPYTTFTGIKLPDGDAARGMLFTDEDHKVEIATVDSRGNPVSVRNLEVTLYKLSWKWWWDTTYEDKSSFTSSHYSRRISHDKVSTVNGKGEYKLRVNYPEWGRYFIRVYDPVSKHSTGEIFYIDWPGWAGAAQRGEAGGENILTFYSDKNEYQVGDVARFTLPSSAVGRALVSVESGNKVVESFWIRTAKGKTEFTLSINRKMAPNVYVHLTMVQPHKNDNDLPIRLYGIVPVSVKDPAAVIKPVIKIADELLPEKEVKFEISEESGRPMAYTVAVVDEGLLSLTNFRTPSPLDSFYSKEAIGVKTWDIYDDVIGAYTRLFGPMLSIGGGGGFMPPQAQKVNRFEPVVRYFGPFQLAPRSTNTHSFVMPRYIGAVRTMVIAENSGAYGHAEKTSLVKESLMVLGTMPRVLGPGENIKLPVNVFMLEDGRNEVKVDIRTEGMLEVSGESSKSMVFNSSGDEYVYFDLKTKDQIGAAKVVINAESKGKKASYEVNINVRPSNSLVSRVETLTVEPGETKQSDISEIGIHGTNSLSMELSFLKPINLTKRLDYLIKYPHGCLEQVVSGVFPQLFLKELTKLTPEETLNAENNINAGIDKIKRYRSGNGGFAYWPGQNDVNDWATSYAGHFLVSAKEKGYAVSDLLLSEWSDYQTITSNRWRPSDSNSGDIVQAYRLYTLALYNKPAQSAMNRLKEKRDKDFRASWILAGAYAKSGNTRIAEEIINSLQVNVEQYNPTSETFGSAERDKAMILETLVLLNKKDEGYKIYNELADILGSDRWLSTQSTAYMLMSMTKFTPEISGDKTINAEYSFRDEKSAINAQDAYYTKKFKSQSGKLSVLNKGKSPLFVKIVNQGIPLKGEEKNEEKNISMTVNYRERNERIVNSVSRLEQGTTLIVETVVRNTSSIGLLEELALSHIVPSGWEIINTKVQGVDMFKYYSDYDYQDIRDDRVLTYFKLKPNESKTFRFMISASYAGDFYYPGVNLEAMYDGNVYSRKAGGNVSVIKK